MEKKNKYEITIVFPNWNGKKETLNFLKSLKRNNFPKEKIEVIMVDNNSDDKSVEAVNRLFPFVSVISLKENAGFAKAVNIGIKKAKGRYIFVCNNDIKVDSDSLDKLYDFLEENPKVGIAGPKVFFLDRPKRVSFSGQKYNFWTGGISTLLNPNSTKDTDWVQGCAMFFSKNLVKKIGFFDEGFFFSFEDFDFCLRTKRVGLGVKYYPKAVVWHGESISIDKTGTANKNFELYKSKFRFIIKNASLLQILTSFILQFSLVGFYKNFIYKDRVFFPFLRGFFSYPVMFKALLWNINNLSETLRVRKMLESVEN